MHKQDSPKHDNHAGLSIKSISEIAAEIAALNRALKTCIEPNRKRMLQQKRRELQCLQLWQLDQNRYWDREGGE